MSSAQAACEVNMDPTDIDDFLEQFFAEGNETADSLTFFEDFPKEERGNGHLCRFWCAQAQPANWGMNRKFPFQFRTELRAVIRLWGHTQIPT